MTAELQQAETERIAACVEACKGISTEALRAGVINKFIWDKLLTIKWNDCCPHSLIPSKDSKVHEGAALLKKHGGSWEEWT